MEGLQTIRGIIGRWFELYAEYPHFYASCINQAFSPIPQRACGQFVVSTEGRGVLCASRASNRKFWQNLRMTRGLRGNAELTCAAIAVVEHVKISGGLG
jgi:hypothetical protein